jgi:hypothetical protein
MHWVSAEQGVGMHRCRHALGAGMTMVSAGTGVVRHRYRYAQVSAGTGCWQAQVSAGTGCWQAQVSAGTGCWQAQVSAGTEVRIPHANIRTMYILAGIAAAFFGRRMIQIT